MIAISQLFGPKFSLKSHDAAFNSESSRQVLRPNQGSDDNL